MNIYLSNNNLDKIFSLKLIKNRQKIISQKLYQERKMQIWEIFWSRHNPMHTRLDWEETQTEINPLFSTNLSLHNPGLILFSSVVRMVRKKSLRIQGWLISERTNATYLCRRRLKKGKEQSF